MTGDDWCDELYECDELSREELVTAARAFGAMHVALFGPDYETPLRPDRVAQLRRAMRALADSLDRAAAKHPTGLRSVGGRDS